MELASTVCRVDLVHESCSCDEFRRRSLCGHLVVTLLRRNDLMRPATLVEKKKPGRPKFVRKALERDGDDTKEGKRVKRNANTTH